jgi:PASTA domain
MEAFLNNWLIPIFIGIITGVISGLIINLIGKKPKASYSFALIIIVIVFLIAKLIKPTLIEVPQLINMSESEATSIISKIDLIPEVHKDWNNRFPKHLVYSQDPQPNILVKKSTKVKIYISKGKNITIVPNINHNSIARAETELKGIGLKVEKIFIKSSKENKYIVISQDPSPGIEVNVGDTIKVYIGNGEIGDQIIPNNIATNLETPIKEDCLPFEPTDLEIRKDGSSWLLTDGFSRMMVFKKKDDANKVIEIILHYGMNSHCFVGRPFASLEYFLVDYGPPSGHMNNEDCIPFNHKDLQIIHVGTRWKLTDSKRFEKWFPNNDEAKTSLKIIEKYGFNRICFVGRPGPKMTYLRN